MATYGNWWQLLATDGNFCCCCCCCCCPLSSFSFPFVGAYLWSVLCSPTFLQRWGNSSILNPKPFHTKWQWCWWWWFACLPHPIMYAVLLEGIAFYLLQPPLDLFSCCRSYISDINSPAYFIASFTSMLLNTISLSNHWEKCYKKVEISWYLCHLCQNTFDIISVSLFWANLIKVVQN